MSAEPSFRPRHMKLGILTALVQPLGGLSPAE